MHRSSSPWQFSTKNKPKAINIAREQVEKQLAAVTELRNYNETYLEHFEQAWINSVIEVAVAVLVKPTDQDELPIQPERISRNTAWLREKLHTRRTKSQSQDIKLPQEQLKLLLTTANSLNSALNLLSCCYDRWLWLKSSKDSEIHFHQTANDLQDFLDWKRHKTGHRAHSGIPRSRQVQQHSTVNALHYDRSYPPRTSTDSTDDSETQLSFLVVETVEKWRQNAEDALNATTKRYHGRSLGSLLRHDREMSSSMPSDTPSAISAQIVRQSHHGAVSLHECVCKQQDHCNKSHSHEADAGIVHLIHHCPQHSYFTVPRRPLARETAMSPAALLHHEIQLSQSKTSRSQSSLLSQPIHPPFLKSLQNSFEKESVGVQALQVSTSSPNSINEKVQNDTMFITNGQTISNISSPESNEIHAHSSTPTGRSQSEVSSESNATASAVFSQPTNDSVVSFQSRPMDGKKASRSRGRLLLEQQEEWERTQQRQSLRPPMP